MIKLKNIAIFLLVTLPGVTSVMAQAPQQFSYQALIRDAGGNQVTNATVGMRISILKTTSSGTAVYVETQTPTTTASGLVSLEIGTGTVVTGTFVGIDWGADIYFLKTETDPAGGTNYTITGTSQLLSVPYALYADGVPGPQGAVGDQGPQGTAGTDGVDTRPTYTVGQFAQGGIVFWVDETGRSGLVCAKTDQSTGVRWYAGTYADTRAYSNGPLGGEINTRIIISSQVALGDDGGIYAARVCNEASITENGFNYGDWYLPSRTELNTIYSNRSAVELTAIANGGSAFVNIGYWTSTEYDANRAIKTSFVDGNNLGPNMGKELTFRVRCVRSF